jgi:hypothetical protein
MLKSVSLYDSLVKMDCNMIAYSWHKKSQPLTLTLLALFIPLFPVVGLGCFGIVPLDVVVWIVPVMYDLV